MTLPLRRKPRTTAPRTTRLRTAAELAVVAALFGGTAAAQQPARYGTPPPGYSGARQAGSPQSAVRSVPLPDRPTGGAAGRVLYFYKPAGSVVPSPNPDTGPDEV